MARRISFGVYELDRDAMELRRRGVLIRLQEQPCRVLLMLAERPGEIVRRINGTVSTRLQRGLVPGYP